MDSNIIDEGFEIKSKEIRGKKSLSKDTNAEGFGGLLVNNHRRNTYEERTSEMGRRQNMSMAGCVGQPEIS